MNTPIKGMNVIRKKDSKSFFAVYSANRLGNMRFNVDGKFYTDKEFEKQFQRGPELWRVNTAALFKEIIEYNQGMGCFFQPINILKGLLAQVAERASQLNDPIMNELMCRLAFYEISDPYNPAYDKSITDETILKGQMERQKMKK